MSLYDLTNDFTELFDQFEQIEAYEPENEEIFFITKPYSII